jgi:hypothetical protein
MKLIEIKQQEPTHKVEIITDASSDKNVIEIITKALHKDCKQIISIYKKTIPQKTKVIKNMNALWRGEGTEVNFYKNSIWQKRYPLWLPKFIHDVSIKAFNDLKLDANRENSIFCGKFEVAANWGRACYMIFPIDGFKYTWFNKSVDLGYDNYYMYDILKDSLRKYLKPEKPLHYSEHDLRDAQKDKDFIKNYTDFVKDIIKDFDPKNTNLDAGLNKKSVTEYLISGKSYYGINSNLIESIPTLIPSILNI